MNVVKMKKGKGWWGDSAGHKKAATGKRGPRKNRGGQAKPDLIHSVERLLLAILCEVSPAEQRKIKTEIKAVRDIIV